MSCVCLESNTFLRGIETGTFPPGHNDPADGTAPYFLHKSQGATICDHVQRAGQMRQGSKECMPHLCAFSDAVCGRLAVPSPLIQAHLRS